MSNPDDWIINDAARTQFLRLAQDTGIFLENRLAELASAFATLCTQKKGARVSAESVTYGSDTEESPLRQLDQRVEFYKEFILDDRTGIQLIMSVLIEAKYRRDVETCAVAYPSGSYRPAAHAERSWRRVRSGTGGCRRLQSHCHAQYQGLQRCRAVRHLGRHAGRISGVA